MNNDENKKLNMEPEEDEVIGFKEGAKVHLVPAYLPYTYFRIVEILRDYYNMELVRCRAYKEGRYPGYKCRYALKNKETGERIGGNIHLDDLRSFFARKEIPLKEEDRNIKAYWFLQIVKEIAKQQELQRETEKGEKETSK